MSGLNFNQIGRSNRTASPHGSTPMRPPTSGTCSSPVTQNFDSAYMEQCAALSTWRHGLLWIAGHPAPTPHCHSPNAILPVLHFAFPPLHVHGRPGGWRIGLRDNRHRGHPGGRAACPRQLPPPLLRLQELPTGTGSGPASRSLGPLPLPATSPVHHLDGGSVSLNADARSHLVMFLSTHFAPHTSFWWFLWLPRLMGVRRPLQR